MFRCIYHVPGLELSTLSYLYACYLVSGKPKIYDEENKALLYGSDDMPSNKQTQKPVRDPFHEKTYVARIICYFECINNHPVKSTRAYRTTHVLIYLLTLRFRITSSPVFAL